MSYIETHQLTLGIRMASSVVLQILGTSDIWVDGNPGKDPFKEGFNLNEMELVIKGYTQELVSQLSRVDFPLIQSINQYFQGSVEFVVLLTDQTGWFKVQSNYSEGWQEIISSDGHWWKEVLLAWAEKHGIRCHCVLFEIDPKVKSGVADWEAMAKQISELLGRLVHSKTISLLEADPITFEQLFVQHSSGTPALSSALYLWGIEQRLAQHQVEFLYVSRQDNHPRQHDGSYWHWRLKVPQIQQLLAVQDFAGILELVKGDVGKDVEKQVRRLDRAVSFNLLDLNLGLDPEREVLERIAIAYWSELAFRERGQWMHWILRVAGAFELVLKCLLVNQGQGQFSWRRGNDGLVDLYYEDEVVFANITAIARGISQGSFLGRKNHQDITYSFTAAVGSQDLNRFQSFYCNQPGWILNQNTKIKFAEIRNDLYHSLQGDVIDRALDQQTQSLGSVTHPDHPSQVAIKHLEFLINLAGIQSRIKERVMHYQELVKNIRESL